MKYFKNKKILNNSGQAAVETLLTTVIFVTAISFAALQVVLIANGWLIANDAAFSAVRCAIVAKGATDEGAGGEDPELKALYAANLVLGGNLPAIVKLWSKNPLESAGEDRSSSNNSDHEGAQIRMFSAHVYYVQKIMFASILQPVNPLRNFGGIFGSFYGGGLKYLAVSKKYGPTGAAHCRMIKSPDWKYYEKAYPDAKTFDE